MQGDGSFRSRPVAGRLFRREQPVLGVFVWEFSSTGMWPILASTGLDFAVVDLEHSGFSVRDTATLLAGGRATSLPALVRVSGIERSPIGRALDLGADGVIAPRVGNGKDAERLVRYAKYGPLGERGVAFGCAHDAYGVGAPSLERFAELANEGTACVAMIETEEGVDEVAAICATPGLDALWIGFADLSQSLGRIGDYEHPSFRSAEERVLSTAAAHEVPVGILVPTAADAIAAIRRGYHAIALGTEAAVLQRGVSDMVREVRDGLDG